jgi:hypothetical protein
MMRGGSKTRKETSMATDITTEPHGTPPEVMEELRKAAEYAMNGVSGGAATDYRLSVSRDQ